MTSLFCFQQKIDGTSAGMRLDQYLAENYRDYSRQLWKTWIEAGQVQVNQHTVKPRYLLKAEDCLEVAVSPPAQPASEHKPQSIPLEIVHADEDLLIVNKAVGMVVHPAAGNREHTLVNALLHYDSELSQLPRAGIVHRLDKETSGLLLVARHLKSYTDLVRQLQAREIRREYRALVQGQIISGGTIEGNIGRDPRHRTRMCLLPEGGKPAITHYRVAERFEHYTLLQVMLETGRTHQIRVHFASIHHPLVGDPTYGGRLKFPKGISLQLKDFLQTFRHQALHAYQLGFYHPRNEEYVEYRAGLPEDFEKLLAFLR